MAALILLLPFSLVWMQDEAGIAVDIIGVDATDLSAVVINASILDSSGQLVSGLDAGNFDIGGDLAGIARVSRVENITDDNLAFASALVIDTSSSMSGLPLEQTKAAARSYVEALGPNDQIALAIFDSSFELLVDYTTDKTELLRVIDQLYAGGQTALYDANREGIELALQAPLPRKAVIILSDGGEYGNVSRYTREESIRAATIHGVPVYTVGLGWHIDQRFLEAVSSESNAIFYNLPRPEELVTIYSSLAYLFRTQYIITIDAPVPADGRRYNFTLNVTTADGRSASSGAVLRAPIPVPLLSLPADLFTAALTETTEVMVDIQADQDIASIEYALDGELVSTDDRYVIEPASMTPGTHTLDIAVSDVDGDASAFQVDFEVAALPPTLSTDFEPLEGIALTEAELISVSAGGQTDITTVEFIIDGEIVKTDREAPYDFSLDPFAWSPGEHVLTLRASNAGGQSAAIDRTFTVDILPPRIQVDGLTSETVLEASLSGSVLAVGQSPIASLSLNADPPIHSDSGRLAFTLNAADFAPGRATVDITAADVMGGEKTETISFEVAALAPTVELSDLIADEIVTGDREVRVLAGGQTEITRIEAAFNGAAAPVRDGVLTVPAELLGSGQHELALTVTNASGQSTTLTLPFMVDLPPPPTFTPTSTDTDVPTATDTLTPTSTDTDVPTATDTLTPTSTDTDVPTATDTLTPTSTDTDVLTPTDTLTPTSTDTDVPTPTNTLAPTSTDTDVPTPTNTLTPTSTDTDVPTATDTLTPTSTDTDVPTATDTLTPTSTDTDVPTATDTLTPTSTDTDVPTATDTPSPTSTDTDIPTATNTPSPTSTDTDVPTATNTPSPTSTDTLTPTATNTPTPTATDTDVPTATNTPTPTSTDTDVPTATNTLTPTSTDTLTPTATNTPTPTATDTDVPTATNTPTPTSTDTDVPTATNTLTPTSTDTLTPTATNTPSPTSTDTDVPTATDTPSPTSTDTDIPTATNTPSPTSTDTDIPTATDTPTSTSTDTLTPTVTNTPSPTATDTDVPTTTNTPSPTVTDTLTPTMTDTPSPTSTDTLTPTVTNTPSPTMTDTPTPTEDVTGTAIAAARSEPTEAPAEAEIVDPTAQPSLTPVTITEVDAPSADEPETRDSAAVIAAVVIGLFLLLILFLLSRRNRR